MAGLLSSLLVATALDSAAAEARPAVAAESLAVAAESLRVTAPRYEPPAAPAPAVVAPPAKEKPKPKAAPPVHAVRISESITVDGMLSEAVWHDGEPYTAFVQRDPVEGAPPSQRTEVRVAFDETALYVAARLHDTAPDSVVARLSRRDASVAADRFAVYLDPYRDRRSGYYFMINAAGTMYDGTLSNDVEDDKLWDGVWSGRARTDDQGWTAEMRIPFSQLRFNRGGPPVWGINFAREIPRRRERAYAAYRPRKASGFVSRFPELADIAVPNGRALELLPYTTSQAEYLPVDPGDPFNDGSRVIWNGGGDLRTRIVDLTLNGTVNPDFGQVEIDPATVNLTDYEDFFEEKRPFFVEGASQFSFGRQGAGDYWDDDWDDPLFFYSRRIGRTPQGRVPSSEFEDVPVVTSIHGAAKLIGRMGPDWSLGTLHAVTAKEYAKLYNDPGEMRDAEIEPAAYYQATRLQREIADRRVGVGVIGTAAVRRFDEPRLKDQLNASSYLGGLDGWWFLDGKRTWVLSGWSALSHVTGTERRMIALQRSSTHYFQRPDAEHVEVDSSATSLTGYATRWWLNKEEGSVLFNSAFGVVDPGFEINDLGFQRRSDMINAHVGSGYKWTKPKLFFRYQTLKASVFSTLDHGGNVTRRGLEASGYTEFKNGHTLNYYSTLDAQALNNRRTRGGPLTLNLPAVSFGTDYLGNTQQRTYPYASFGGTVSRSGSAYGYAYPGVEWRPMPALSVKATLGWERLREDAQWVATEVEPGSPTYNRRYVFATLDQRTMSASLRLNWAFTPTLALQTYIQPYVSSADYHDFKKLAAARTYDFIPIEYSDDPHDFKDWSLRGNAVLRWEYRTGSALYLVWTQKRSERYDDPFQPMSPELVGQIPTENILLAKLTYYFSL
jgi:hypothetical protein